MPENVTQNIIISFKSVGEKDIESALKRLSKTTDSIPAGMKAIDTVTKRYDESTGKAAYTLQRKMIPQMQRFRFEALGIMFGGMAVERAFGKITQAGFDLYKIGDLLNATYGIMMLPIMDILAEGIFGLTDFLMGLDPEVQKAIGGMLLFGQAIGTALMGLGQAILFISSLKMIGGLPGLFKELTGVFESLGKFAGKTLDTTINFIMKWGSEFLKFFTRGAEWLLGSVRTAVDMIQGKIDAMVTWLFGGGTLASAAKIVVSIAVAFIILDLATRFLSWAFKALGEGVGKETTLGKVMIFVGATLSGGYIDAIAKAFFSPEYAVGREAVFNAVIKLTLAPLWGLPVAIQNLINGKPIEALISLYMGPLTAYSSVALDVIGGIKKLFGLAEGGIVTRPTPAIIGERGPEAVIPLNESALTNIYQNNYINASIHNDMDIAEVADKLNRYLSADYKRLRYA
jgi:hypothetical protein